MAKKNNAISLSIAEYDLEKLKEKPASDGIPFEAAMNQELTNPTILSYN